ncbi:MAG: hypothetical protein LBL52_00570 [Rickettsiales bacterium]|nr:hypothetical protein [Rickettsiales bacterium]
MHTSGERRHSKVVIFTETSSYRFGLHGYTIDGIVGPDCIGCIGIAPGQEAFSNPTDAIVWNVNEQLATPGITNEDVPVTDTLNASNYYAYRLD